jgi:hypothetical protein
MPRWYRLARSAAWFVAIGFAALYWFYLTSDGGNAVDAHAYWAADPNHLYGNAADPVEHGSYLYSPAFELVIGWGRLLPFEVFAAIWRALLLVVLVWLAGPLTLPVLLFVPVASEVNAGNIQILLAASVVAGFRYVGTWAFPLLTKFTCGVGLIWFMIRREWHHLAVALATTGAIALLTFVIWPGRWVDYAAFITQGAPNLPAVPPFYWPLAVRLPFAVVIVVIASLRGWRWLLVAGTVIALPIFYVPSIAMFVGVLPYVRSWAARQLTQRLAPTSAAATVASTAPGSGSADPTDPPDASHPGDRADASDAPDASDARVSAI